MCRKRAVLWFLTVFFVLAMLIYMPSLASLIFGVVAILNLPIGKWQDFVARSMLQKLAKFKTGIILIAAFGGILIAPVPEQERAADNTTVDEAMRDTVAVGKEDDLSGNGAMGNNIRGETVGVSDVLQTAVPVENESYFEVHYLDVGEADAALVLCDGEAMLIDGGNTNDSSFLYSYLKEQGITYLSYIVASHAHEDHVGGIAGALNFAEVGVVYCPVAEYDSEPFCDFLKYIEKQNKDITVPAVGESFALGSADSSSLEFLKAVSPEYAIISVGSNNAVGHPHEKVLIRLKDMGTKVYRTDLQGTIIASSDGETVTIAVEKNMDADTFVPGATATPVVIVTAEPTKTPEATKELERTEAPVPIVTPEPVMTSEPEIIFTPTGTAEPGDRNLVEALPEETAAPTETQVPVTEEKTYVLNTNTMKFHNPDCRHVDDIKSHNYAEFVGSYEEVIGMGYVGCKICKPR